MNISMHMEGTPYECAAAMQIQSAWDVYQSLDQYEDVNYDSLIPLAEGLMFLLDQIGRCDSAWEHMGRETEPRIRFLPERLRHIADLLDAGKLSL
jgi:hypothetical protein